MCNYECYRLGKLLIIYIDFFGKKIWIYFLNIKCIIIESVKVRKLCVLIIYSLNDVENCKINYGRIECVLYFVCLLEGINILKIKNMYILKFSEYNFMWNKFFNV